MLLQQTGPFWKRSVVILIFVRYREQPISFDYNKQEFGKQFKFPKDLSLQLVTMSWLEALTASSLCWSV